MNNFNVKIIFISHSFLFLFLFFLNFFFFFFADLEKTSFPLEDDDESLFLGDDLPSSRGSDAVYFKKRTRNEEDQYSSNRDSTEEAAQLQDAYKRDYHLFLLTSWEDKIIWEDENPGGAKTNGYPADDKTYRYLDMARLLFIFPSGFDLGV